VKHNLLRSRSPPEGGPAERSRSGLSPVSQGRAILLRPTDHAFGAVPAAEECGCPAYFTLRSNLVQKTDGVCGCGGDYACRPLGSPSITAPIIENSSGRKRGFTYSTYKWWLPFPLQKRRLWGEVLIGLLALDKVGERAVTT
jgi:hypothetical protein